VKKENPGSSVADVAKILGAMWKKISAAEKAKYVERQKAQK
jgi:hypothetical protein